GAEGGRRRLVAGHDRAVHQRAVRPPVAEGLGRNVGGFVAVDALPAGALREQILGAQLAQLISFRVEEVPVRVGPCEAGIDPASRAQVAALVRGVGVALDGGRRRDLIAERGPEAAGDDALAVGAGSAAILAASATPSTAAPS